MLEEGPLARLLLKMLLFCVSLLKMLELPAQQSASTPNAIALCILTASAAACLRRSED
jgi:hypothetical protein